MPIWLPKNQTTEQELFNESMGVEEQESKLRQPEQAWDWDIEAEEWVIRRQPSPTMPTTSTVPKTPTELYKLPKIWTEKGMEAVGGAISKMPILPDILEFAAPAFEWIHENLERPFASFITAPFSPTLEWKSGESWLEHEKENTRLGKPRLM